MKKRLFEVTLTMLVLSDDEVNALQIAQDNASDAIDLDTLWETALCSSVPQHLSDAFPWTDDDDEDEDMKTCGQILEEQIAQAKYAKQQMVIPK